MLEIKFSGFPVLETERMIYRQITEKDAKDIFELRTDKQILKYSDRAPMKNIEEAIDMVKKITSTFTNNEAIAWVMELKETKNTIGHITYWRIIKEHHRAEIGYTMFPQYWGKGFMTEAIKKIIDYGFSQMK